MLESNDCYPILGNASVNKFWTTKWLLFDRTRYYSLELSIYNYN